MKHGSRSQEENVADVVGAPSSEGFLVSHNFSHMLQYVLCWWQIFAYSSCSARPSNEASEMLPYYCYQFVEVRLCLSSSPKLWMLKICVMVTLAAEVLRSV